MTTIFSYFVYSLGDHDKSSISGKEHFHHVKKVDVPPIFNKKTLEHDIGKR